MQDTVGPERQEGSTDRRGGQGLSWGGRGHAIGVPCIQLGLSLPGLSSPLSLY